MTAPIFFNVEEARDYLLKTGHVYTLRNKRKTTGITEARHGSYMHFELLGKVRVEEIVEVKATNVWTILEPYVAESGFNSVSLWLVKLADGSRRFPQWLYRVTKVG
jgi:hypothetical protein